MKQHWRHLNNRIRHKHKSKHSGQSLVEFALVSMILFSVLLGIIELGRLMFIFSQVSSAAQEASRFGASYPLQVATQTEGASYPYHVRYTTTPPAVLCTMISQGRARVTLLDQTDVQIFVWYDDGSNGTALTDVPPFQVGYHRVVVQALYQFHPLTGIFDRFMPNGLNIQMISARTILSNQAPPASGTDILDPTCPDGPPP
jgi:Flp pilus assembly protein TadG